MPPIPKPVSPRAYSCLNQNVERWWRTRYKPPNTAVTTRRHNNNVVNKNLDSSATKHLPSTEAASVLPIRPPAHSLRYPNSKLVVRAQPKPPIQAAYPWFLYETVSTLSRQAGLATYLGRTSIMRNAAPRHLLHSFVSLEPYCRGRGVSHCLRLLVAVFGQRN